MMCLTGNFQVTQFASPWAQCAPRAQLASLRQRWAVVLASLTLLIAGCGEPTNNSRAVFVLVDISSDYASELMQARSLTNYLLADLEGGDSLAVAFIDNSSFTERNIIARASFDSRPSFANQQKRAFQAQVNAFFERFRVPSYHSDITGGVLLARDFLTEADAGRSYLFILSDLHEDLPPWLNRDVGLDLEGIEVVAINIKRQRSDNNDPQAYQARLSTWQSRVEEGGGSWRTYSDLARLERAGVLR